MVSRRTYAVQLGGMFLLLNILRVGFWHSVYRRRLKSMAEVARDTRVIGVVADTFQDAQVPSYLTKPVRDLTADEKATIRLEFYANCNMPTVSLYRWLQDPRVADGHGRRPFEHVRQKVRLRQVIAIKAAGRMDGRGWSDRSYQAARECVFVYQNLFNPRTVDYVLWATLRNYGLDWGRRNTFGWSRSLPRRVKLDALVALARHQKTGKRPKRRLA